MPAGTWIYEKGTVTGGGSGTYVPPDAPPVVIGAVSVREVYDGRFEVTVDWTAGSGAATVGVGVFLEDPDISASAEAPMDGTIPLDGTSAMSGKWKPVKVDESYRSPTLIDLDGQPTARNVRIYLQAFSTVKNATLIRANQSGPTPNVVATIPAAAGQYVSGQEYAWLVTGTSVIVVPEFDNPAGPKYHLEFGYTAPNPALPLPPGLKDFAGVMTVYEYDDGTQKEALFLDRDKPQDWHSDAYDAGAGGHFKVWFCSRDVDGRRNSIVRGVTPMVDVTVVYPPVGQMSAPYITNFTLTPQSYLPTPDGSLLARARLDWKQPMLADGVTPTPRYAGVGFYRIDVTPPFAFGSLGPRDTTLVIQTLDWPKVAQAWTIVAISVDANGKQSDSPAAPSASAPRVTWNIGPPTAGTSSVTIGSATVTTEQLLSTDGVVMMRHTIKGWTEPADNTFGGVSIARIVHSGDPSTAIYWYAAKGTTTLVTDWEPAPAATAWDFYFVSRDMTAGRNPIQPGITPAILNVTFTPMEGNIIPSRLPAGWWDPAEFQWPTYPAGYFQALSFVAKKIFVGSILRVGGGTGVNDPTFGSQQNGQIAVYNSSNVLRGWIGQQNSVGTPDNPGAHSVFGAWFTELYVGGDSPVNAPLYATQAGAVIVGGFDVVGSKYPYISIRDNTGVEVGRMGARIGYGQAGIETTIQGAWFREFAYGGQSFADWRMLAKMDVTNPTGANVQMRNINKFSIDYMQNYPNAGNPTNAAMHLEFGYDAFAVPDGAGNSSFWKFPGLVIYRTTGTSPLHGAALINRGSVIRGPNNVGGFGGKLAALVSFNGDSTGNDATSSTWWAELTMSSPVSGAINVDLGSGSAGSGASFFTLRDGGGALNFSVDGIGSVIIRNNLSVGLISAVGMNSSAQVNGSAFGIFSIGNGHAGPTTFTSADGKTVTVRGGLVMSIV